MPDFDLLIRGTSPHEAIGISDGKIAALSKGTARETINATGPRLEKSVRLTA